MTYIFYNSQGQLMKHADAREWGGIQQGLSSYRWDEFDNGTPVSSINSGIFYYTIVSKLGSTFDTKKGSVVIVN